MSFHEEIRDYLTLSERGQKGGQISAERRKLQSVANWLVRFPGTSPEAARTIYEAGYKSGTQAKYQQQKRQQRQAAQALTP